MSVKKINLKDAIERLNTNCSNFINDKLNILKDTSFKETEKY